MSLLLLAVDDQVPTNPAGGLNCESAEVATRVKDCVGHSVLVQSFRLQVVQAVGVLLSGDLEDLHCLVGGVVVAEADVVCARGADTGNGADEDCP